MIQQMPNVVDNSCMHRVRAVNGVAGNCDYCGKSKTEIGGPYIGFGVPAGVTMSGWVWDGAGNYNWRTATGPTCGT